MNYFYIFCLIIMTPLVWMLSFAPVLIFANSSGLQAKIIETMTPFVVFGSLGICPIVAGVVIYRISQGYAVSSGVLLIPLLFVVAVWCMYFIINFL